MPTYSPDDSKTNEDKSKSYPKGKPQAPNSHTDLLMSLMQSQQPTPSNTMGGHTGAGETHRDRKVLIVDNVSCISSFFSIVDVNILVRESYSKTFMYLIARL